MKKILLFAVAAVLGASAAMAQAVKPFQEGERAVFLGNSITDGGHYHSYIWLYYMTHFPDMRITCFNAGIGGDTAFDENKRLDNDVFSKNPTFLSVTFGMNDSGYYEYNGKDGKEFGEKKYEDCIKNFENMVARFRQLPHTRIMMLGSSPFDETSKCKATVFKGKNAVMRRIVDYQRQTAEKYNWEFMDLNVPMSEINERMQQTDPKFTLCGEGDRIHPDNEGHMVMAWLFLKAQGLAGKPVADFEVNASKQKVVKAENCEITNVKKAGANLSFNYLAKSLPLPLDTIARGWGQKRAAVLATKCAPIMEDLNSEILKVTGLKGNYDLVIDDEVICTLTGAQLAEGVNLAEYTNTPQYQQALAIMEMNEMRWSIERDFRDYAWCQHGFFQQQGLLEANNRTAINVWRENLPKNLWLNAKRDLYSRMMHKPVRDAMNAEMKALVDEIYRVNKPIDRRVELRKK